VPPCGMPGEDPTPEAMPSCRRCEEPGDRGPDAWAWRVLFIVLFGVLFRWLLLGVLLRVLLLRGVGGRGGGGGGGPGGEGAPLQGALWGFPRVYQTPARRCS